MDSQCLDLLTAAVVLSCENKARKEHFSPEFKEETCSNTDGCDTSYDT